MILVSFENYSQILKEKELNKIATFGIELTNYNLNEKRVINDWNLIIDKDRKRKIKKTTYETIITDCANNAFFRQCICVCKEQN